MGLNHGLDSMGKKMKINGFLVTLFLLIGLSFSIFSTTSEYVQCQHPFPDEYLDYLFVPEGSRDDCSFLHLQAPLFFIFELLFNQCFLSPLPNIVSGAPTISKIILSTVLRF
jgi:hypothetical protein